MKIGDWIWLGVLAAIIVLLVHPLSHMKLVLYTKMYPYLMGFCKVSVLATLGELLAVRIETGNWARPVGLCYRLTVWGLFGMSFVLVFEIFSSGVLAAAMKGLLPKSDGFFAPVLSAFFISAAMNLAFAPTMMALHRITDTYIDLLQGDWSNCSKINVKMVVGKIDWQSFVSFVVLRTIPVFWIPAHTVTFLLPPEYRVLLAALLSVALGAILAFSKRLQQKSTVAI